MDSLIQYNNAVNAIKTAILQGQYEAAKGVNRIQLALYSAIGKYLSQHTRKGVWGEGALASISEQLRKELPDLRRFSETQMKDQQTTLMQNMLFETTASRWELLPTRRWMTCLKGYARLCLI